MNPNNKNKTIRQKAKIAFCLIILSVAANNLQAIILYSGDNSANLTAPDPERTAIFNSVAKITNADGTGIVGSAVHIKDKYLLTAEHVLYKNVTPRRSHISFDGTTYLPIDLEFSPIQIANADLVLFKILENPNLPETQLYSSSNELNKTGTLIGWGYGRDSNQPDLTSTSRTWSWGSGSTINKRWGTNQIANIGNTNISGKVYDFLQTRLNSNQGDHEASFAYYDSGSGIYILNSGTWQLAGVTTAVSAINGSFTSTFAQFSGASDSNYFVRVSQYRQTIQNSIPDPSSYTGWLIDNSLYGTNAESSSDPDDDGLDNQTEFDFNLNPNLADSDNDGLLDGAEFNTHFTDPLDADSDNDGLIDGEEINTHNSNPLDDDSDNDGLIDGVEVNTYDTDPNNNDSDADEIPDSDEINIYNTNPNNYDSDTDGLSDSDEINIFQSNPNNADTSNDGFSDQVLVGYGLNPNANHTLLYNAVVQSIADLRAGSTIIEVISNQAMITLNLESSDDLLSWTQTGDTAIINVPTTNDTQFYRFVIGN